jgi:hypothetical protein
MSRTCGQAQQQRDRHVIRCRNGRANDHRGVAGVIETDQTVATAAPGHGPVLVQKKQKRSHATGLQIVLSPTDALPELSGEQEAKFVLFYLACESLN